MTEEADMDVSAQNDAVTIAQALRTGIRLPPPAPPPPPPDLAALEQALEEAVAERWRRGWQPAELVRAVDGRWTPTFRRLLRTAVLAESQRYRSHPHADPDWLAQVDALAGRIVRDEGGTAGWLARWAAREHVPVGREHRMPEILLRALRGLPDLVMVGPPPDDWGPATAAAARARSAAVRGDDGDGDAKVLARVRALLAKAESTTYPEEADALVGKAQELMTRHAIDRALVTAGASGAAERPEARRVPVHDPYAKAKVALLMAVASSCRCRAVWTGGLKLATVFGFPSDLALVDVLYTSLLAQAASAMGRVPASVAGEREIRSRSFRQSFLVAYTDRIAARLREAQERTTAAAVDDEPGVLPALLARDDEVERALRNAFPDTGSFTVSGSSPAGWAAGVRAADAADIGDRVRVPGGRKSLAAGA